MPRTRRQTTGLILAGDVGGTKTNVALFQSKGARLKLMSQKRVRNRSYPSLEAILKEFLKEQRATPIRACLGLAGPIVDSHCEATNLPWVIDTQRVKRAVDLDAVTLLNDLEATAYGLETLPHTAFAVLNKGRPHRFRSA